MTTRTGSQLTEKRMRQIRQLILQACCFVGITAGAVAQTSFGVNALPASIPTNSAFGEESQFSNTGGVGNAAVGEYSMRSNVSGNNNSALGFEVMYGSTGSYNCAVGAQTMYGNTGDYNNGFGHLALYNNNGFANSAVGYAALYSNTTGSENNAFGLKTLGSNNNGSNNSAFGSYALTANSSGSNNSAFGYNALYNNQTGNHNDAFGYQALYNNTTGYGNSAVGTASLISNSSGDYNVSMGYKNMASNSTGKENSAVGVGTLSNNTTGNYNAAFGAFAMSGSSAVSYLGAFGYYALASNSTGADNNAFGAFALTSNTSGNSNTAMGYKALGNNNTGSNNTAHGLGALNNNVVGSCNTALGYGAGTAAANLNNTIAIGCNVSVTVSNRALIGNAATTSIGGPVNWAVISDARFKDNVKEDVPGINFIKKLRPVTYTYDLKAYDSFTGVDESKLSDCYVAGREARTSVTYTGFIAQEVEKAAEELNYEFSGVDKPANENTPYALRYAEFVVPIVKAMQEQQSVIEAQQKQIETQATEMTSMKQRLERLESLLLSQDKMGAGAVETGNNSSLNVYPNPTDGIVKISLNNESRQTVNLQLADVTGKVILKRSSADAAINMSFDLTGYPAGNYMLTVTQGSQTMSKVIVFGGK